jgi:PAS domain S-box-containing protein
LAKFIERKRSEEALRESEARYRVVVETASDAIFTIDQDSTILFANPGAERLFGYSREELIGCPLTILMPEYLRHIHRAGLKRYIDTGRRHISWQGVELPGLHKSGREIPVEISFGELLSGGQHLFTGVVRDISERKNIEQTRSWLAAIVENSEDAIIGKTLDGVITSRNIKVRRTCTATAPRRL